MKYSAPNSLIKSIASTETDCNLNKIEHKDIYSEIKLKMLPYKVIQKIMKDREIITQFRSVYFNTHLLIEFYKNNTDTW